MAIEISTPDQSSHWYLSTPSNPIGKNQTNFSYHFAFKFTPAPDNSSSNKVFSQGLGFGIYNSINRQGGVGTPTVGFFQITGASGSATAINFVLNADVTYFIDMNWAPGVQLLYVNGIVKATFAISGNTQNSNQPIDLGCIVGSTGYTLIHSNPAFWDGYTTTSTDVENMLFGTTPNNLSNQPDWYMSLAGTTGVTPVIGDPGLTNSGTAGTGSIYNFSTINSAGTPTAQYVPDLTSSFPPLTPQMSPSGGIFTIGVTSPSGLPSDDASVIVASKTSLPTLVVTHADHTVDTISSWYQPVYTDVSNDCAWVMYRPNPPFQVLPTDTLTYSLPFNAFSTKNLGPNGLVSNQPVNNQTGTYGLGFNGVQGDQPVPTSFKIGHEGTGGFYHIYDQCPSKNLRLRFPKMNAIVYDLNNTPLYSIVPNTPTFGNIWDIGNNSNFIDSTGWPTPTGVFSLVFHDMNANDPVNWFQAWIVTNANYVGGDTRFAPNTGTGTTYDRYVVNDFPGSISGWVYIHYWLKYASIPNAGGYNGSISVYVNSKTGYITMAGPGAAQNSGPVSGFKAFAPGDSTTTRYAGYDGPFPNAAGDDITAPPLAASAYQYKLLKSSNGATPTCNRPMTQNPKNWQVLADIPTASRWSFADDIQQPRLLPMIGTVEVTNGSTSIIFSNTQTIANNSVFAFDSSGLTYTVPTGSTGTNFTLLYPFQGTTSLTATPQLAASQTVPLSAIRQFNVNPSNSNYPYVTTKVYHKIGGDGNDYPLVGANNPEAGNFFDLTMHSGGTSGEWTSGLGFLEAVTSVPLPYRTSDVVTFAFSPITMFATTCGPNQYWGVPVSVTNGSPTIVFASIVTIKNNTVITLTGSGTHYTIATGGSSNIFTLNANFNGPTYASAVATQVVLTPLGTANVTNGSSTLTFGSSVTIPSNTWVGITGSNQNYLIPTGGTGTVFTMSPGFGGTTGSATVTISSGTPLLSTASVNNGSNSVTFFSPQVFTSNPDTSLMFNNDGFAYTVSPTYGQAVSGTVHVQNGSTSITFSSSVTITNNSSFTFDSTGTVYTVPVGGTGTNFTISPAFSGTNNPTATAHYVSAQTFTLSAPYAGLTSNSAPVQVVASVQITQNDSAMTMTGESSFVFGSGLNRNVVPGPPLQLLATSPISISALNLVITPYNEIGGSPYEFAASHAVEFNMDPWIFLQAGMSDACLRGLAILLAAIMPDGSVLKVELGDEHWNGVELLRLICLIYGELFQWVTPGATVSPFVHGPATPQTISVDAAYTFILGNQVKVMQDQFTALGRNIKVQGMYGTQWTQASVTENIINAATDGLFPLTEKIPIGSIVVAPYMTMPFNGSPNSNITFGEAFATTGTNPGSWPAYEIAYIHGMYLKYSTSFWNLQSAQYAACQLYATNGGPPAYGQINGIPSLSAYENGNSNNLTSNEVARDVFYSPGPYHPYTGWYAAIMAFCTANQHGDPRVPNSGIHQSCFVGIDSYPPPAPQPNWWCGSLFQNQPPGDGSGNLYPTWIGTNTPAGSQLIPGNNQFSSPQGGPAGPSGYNKEYSIYNQSLAHAAILDWQALSNPTTFIYGTDGASIFESQPQIQTFSAGIIISDDQAFAGDTSLLSSSIRISEDIAISGDAMLLLQNMVAQIPTTPSIFAQGLARLLNNTGVFGPNAVDLVIYKDNEIKWPVNPVPFCLVDLNPYDWASENIGGGRFEKTWTQNFKLYIVVGNILDISWKDTILITSQDNQLGPYRIVDNVINTVEQAFITDLFHNLILVELPYAKKVRAPKRYPGSNEYSYIEIEFYVKLYEKLPAKLP